MPGTNIGLPADGATVYEVNEFQPINNLSTVSYYIVEIKFENDFSGQYLGGTESFAEADVIIDADFMEDLSILVTT